MFGLAGLLLVLVILLGLVSFVASVWLVVVAFKQGPLWGLATLFIPFAALVFVIKFWRESKKPFLLSVGSGVAMILVALIAGIGAASAASRHMSSQIAAEMAKTRSQAGGPAHQSAASPAARVEPSEAPPADSPTRQDDGLAAISNIKVTVPAAAAPAFDLNAITPDGFAPIAPRDAKGLEGRRAKVVSPDGHIHPGELVKADANGVRLQRYVGGGTLIVDYRRSEIDKLLVEVTP